MMFAVILSVGILSVASADELKPLYAPEDVAALESYAKRSETVSQSFDEDEYLTFNVDLPQNWVSRQLASLKNFSRRGRLHGDLARFDGRSVGDLRSHFRVRSVELPREISAKNWLMTYLLSNGYTLYSLQVNEDGSGFDAMYVIFSGTQGQGFIIRTRGIISGPRIILGEYVMPTGLWQQERDQQAFVVGSFSVEAEDQDWIEDKEFFTYLEALEFDYPNSWAITDRDDNAQNTLHVILDNNVFSRVSEGEIAISTSSTQSIKDFTSVESFDIDLPALVKRARDRIADKGYVIEGKSANRTLLLDHAFKLQRTEVYPLRPVVSEYDSGRQANVSHELWMTVLVNDGRVIVSTLLTPSRDQDLYSWAVNARAYERIVGSIR